MKIVFILLLGGSSLLFGCSSTSTPAQAQAGYSDTEIAVAEFILTMRLYRTVTLEMSEICRDIGFRSLSDNEKIDILKSDKETQVVTRVLRMVYGRCEIDTASELQYAVQDGNGGYKLQASGYKQGVMADLTYEVSTNSADTIELTGICGIKEILGRKTFHQYPKLDAGKPFGPYGGGFKSQNHAKPIKLGEEIVVQQYAVRRRAAPCHEVIVATIYIERATEWNGDLAEILNHLNVWCPSDNNPLPGGGIRKELIIKRPKKVADTD